MRPISKYRRNPTIALGLLGLLSCYPLIFTRPLAAEELSREQLDFFEAKIRAVLVEKCYGCHSEEAGESEGGLLVDTGPSLRTGGSSGAAIVPGSLDQSLLWTAIGYQNDALQMPPEDAGGKLSEETLADFKTWIQMGAPDPRAATRVPPAHDMGVADRHWAFQPIVKPNLPNVSTASPVPEQAIDAFVTEKLHAQQLELNPLADRRTLLRRLSLDLTGLPPTFEQVQAFEQDPDGDAYAKVVDRLLDSPAYGERWARHWMDVARYADTRGYLAGGLQERYAFSHTYRDYLIQAFNDDKAYDQMILEQLAADQLELGDNKQALAAMGYLTLGRRFINNTHLIIDDRIDVTMRGLMGLTVTCARCHDHKFDPIPSADYYSLHGVFASSEEPGELPLLEREQQGPQYDAFVAARKAIEEKIESIRNREIDTFIRQEQQKTGDYLLAALQVEDRAEGTSFDDFAGERKVDARILRRWQAFLMEPGKTTHPVLVAWFASQQNVEGGIAAEDANLLVRRFFQKSPPEQLTDVAAIYNQLSRQAVEAPSDDTDEPTAEVLQFLRDSPSTPDRAEVGSWISRHVHNQTAGLQRDIEALNWTHEGAPTRAHVLVDQTRPQDSRILKRGNPGSPGDVVPRRYLEVFSGAEREPFRHGSGRLELAQRIASPDNPLTARVFVNRVWAWHFGRPLVDTPSDFGVRTPAPEQLDLLNWLAADFIEHGWSIKHLHRRIVRAQTYQQSSRVRETAFQKDPENRLFHHFSRRRLGFEATRDTMLMVTGELDMRIGGLPVDITKPTAPPRRTVYAYIERQDLPGLFRTFDFPSPDASAPGRFVTTVPQQGLFMLNSPFAGARARALAKRTEGVAEAREKIRLLYQLVFQREPNARETSLGLEFVKQTSGPVVEQQENDPDLDGWELYVQTLMLSNELVFIN